MADCYDTLLARRTRKAMDGTPLSRTTVERLLQAGHRAPQHRMSHPWRFSPLDQAGITELGRWILASRQVVEWPDANKGPRKAAKLVDDYFPTLGAMIQVTQVIADDPEVDLEDHAATAAAAQNILLAAEAAGLASFWSSSAALRHPDTLARLGADPDRERFVASVWLWPLESCCRWQWTEDGR